MIKKITLLIVVLAGAIQTTAFGMRFKRLAKYSKFAFTGLAVRGTALKFKKDACEEEELPKKYGKLTIDEAAHKLYDRTMTNDELRALCVGLLQDRIDYWYALLAAATTEEEKRTVPLYIRHHQNPRITAEQMIGECKFEKLAMTEASGAVQSYPTDQDKIIALLQDKSWAPVIMINKKYSNYTPLIMVMYTILHEITHVEQVKNTTLYASSLPELPSKTTISHHYAQKRDDGDGDFDLSLNKQYLEREADTAAIEKGFNPLLYTTFFQHIEIKKPDPVPGYLSWQQTIELAKDHADKYYKQYPHRLARDQKQVEYWKKNFPPRHYQDDDYVMLGIAIGSIVTVVACPIIFVVKSML